MPVVLQEKISGQTLIAYVQKNSIIFKNHDDVVVAHMEFNGSNICNLGQQIGEKNDFIITAKNVVVSLTEECELFADLEDEDFENVLNTDEYAAFISGDFIPESSLIYQIWTNKRAIELSTEGEDNE